MPVICKALVMFILISYLLCPVYKGMIRMLRYQETVGVNLCLSSFMLCFCFSSVSIAPVFCTVMGRVTHAAHDNSNPDICEYCVHELM